MSRIAGIDGFCLSSPYGDGTVLGQPKGVKSLGFVEICLRDGRKGIGESYAGVYAPELIGPAARFLAERLETEDAPLALERLRSANFLPFIGSSGLMRSVASALDTALLDILAQQRKVPLWRLLTRKPRRAVRVYASGGSAAMSPSEVAEDVRRCLLSGHTAFKMRVGYHSWKTDLRRVSEARAALGKNGVLMVDAIMGTISPPWTPEEAQKKISALSRFSPIWIEEPLSPENISALSRLRRRSRLPLAAGESWTSRAEFDAALELRSVDVVQPDAAHCGGIAAAVDICRKARLKEIRSALHVWGSPVAFLANFHAAAACSAVDYLEVPGVELALAGAMGWQMPRPHEGELGVPRRPGLGIRLSDEVKKAFPFVPKSGYVWGRRGRTRP